MPARGLHFPRQVQRHAGLHAPPGSHPVNGLLHLAVAAVAALHRVRGGRQQFVVQERQRLLQIRRIQLRQGFAHRLEPFGAPAQPGQFLQGGVGSAAAVEQAVDLIHDFPQHPQFRQAAGDALQRPAFACGKVVGDEQIAMLEEFVDPLMLPLIVFDVLAFFFPGPAARQGRQFGLQCTRRTRPGRRRGILSRPA